MNNLQILGRLDNLITQIHNAMDEVGDIQDNEAAKDQAIRYLVQAEMTVYKIIDEVDAVAIANGERSGAV